MLEELVDHRSGLLGISGVGSDMRRLHEAASSNPDAFERRRVSVLIEQDGQRRLIVKGAPEDVLKLSGRYQPATGEEAALDDATRRSFAATFEELGAQGYRALGIASKLVDAGQVSAAVGDESELVFAGFAVFLDPPKASAGATVKALAEAGISPG